jgi:hypothetical protein
VATVALTQYHRRDGGTVGMMSTPWRTAISGTTSFSRFGRIEPDVAAVCLSTGLDKRADGVFARNVDCVRPVPNGSDHLVTKMVTVPLTDPLVGAPLSRYPADGTAPTAPVCRVDCMVSPYVTGDPGALHATKDTPISGPVEPLDPYEPVCHTVNIKDSFAGPSDENVNGFDIWMTGAVDSCDPDGQQPDIRAIRYWSDRGIVMPSWELAQDPLAKGAQVNESTIALCVASGIRKGGDGLYGVHDLCWRIVRDQPDRYLLVPIPTDDPLVTKPLDSNIPEPGPAEPGGPCASCL